MAADRQRSLNIGEMVDIIAAAERNEPLSTISSRMNVSVSSVQSVVNSRDAILSDVLHTRQSLNRHAELFQKHFGHNYRQGMFSNPGPSGSSQQP